MASVKWGRVGLLVAVAMLIAAPAWADIYFDYRLDPVQPEGVTVSSDLKTGSVAPGLLPGTEIKVNIYAVITNTATAVTAKKLSRSNLSQYSAAASQGTNPKMHGNLQGNADTVLNPVPYVASNYRGALANSGQAKDISIPLDGDIDVGSFVQSGAMANEFFCADGGSAFASSPLGSAAAASWGVNAAEFLIGTNFFTLSEPVRNDVQTEAILQLWPRIKTDGTVTAKNTTQWWENGSTLLSKPGTDPLVHAGAPIDLISTVPEPTALVLLGVGIFGFLVIRSRRKK